MTTGRYNLIQIATVAYFTNLGHRLAIGSDDSIEDFWAQQDDLRRESYRHGTLFALTHRPSPAQQHDEWVRWHRQHGVPHENLVGWHELRPQEQDKDRLFLNNVISMADL